MKAYFKTFFLLLPVILLLTVSACKKGTTTTTCQLVRAETLGIDTFNTTYNAEGRVATFIDPHLWGSYTFSYSGLSAGASIVYTDTSFHFTNTMTLNTNGDIVYMSNPYTNNGNSYNQTYSLQYDAEGHVIWCEYIRTAPAGSTVSYKDSFIYFNGNLIEAYTFEKGGGAANYSLYKHVTMEYGTDLNKIGYYISYGSETPMSATQEYLPYAHMLGAFSKNMPTLYRYYDGTNTLLFQLNFTFLFNENGYPTEESMVRSISFPGSRNRKFIYSCD